MCGKTSWGSCGQGEWAVGAWTVTEGREGRERRLRTDRGYCELNSVPVTQWSPLLGDYFLPSGWTGEGVMNQEWIPRLRVACTGGLQGSG